MRIVMTLLVRDEADVIAANLDYHLAQGVDHVIVTDNGSRDGSRALLTGYHARGQVTVFDEPPADFSQHRWVTRMARLACTEFDADWVINADADEAFVWRDGTLREALQRVPTAAHSLIANRTDFVPFERPGRRSPFIEMVYRMAVSMNVTGQPLPPKVLHRGVADVVISQGNHRAHSSQFVGGPAPGPIEVFHYPVRSFTQFASKVHNGGSGYARNRELSPKTGVHKRRWYEQLLQGELEDEYQQNLFFDAVRLQDSLASGTVLLDRTLADRMASLPGFNADGAASVP